MATYRTRTGLELDESDPTDRAILRRQRAAAATAGAEGADRAGTTGGRTDLQAAFDGGAATRSAPPAPAAAQAPKPAAGRAPKPRKSVASRVKGAASSITAATPAPTLTPPRKLRSADLGGFALGLVLHALVLSYIRYGKAGPKGWLSAKFLNQPIEGEDLERENRGGSRHENPDSVPWEDLTPEERENII